MEPTPEQLAAGQPKGLTPEMCARLRGETPEELSADADTFLTEWAPQAPPAPTPRSGGNRGSDVGSGSGTVSGGAARYRQRHGLDEDGRRPERRQADSDGRNPWRENGYTMER
ncbi:hypothetical protein [Streptomyces sp. NPDC018693]|uniref:hypothetical protein n=1 Tax=unclassified Streptomyces TaxID=2593676 RepID=UPI0037B9F18A